MQAIDRAWRSKVSHFEAHIVPTGEYTRAKAEAIFVGTRSLMDLLARELGKATWLVLKLGTLFMPRPAGAGERRR